MNQFPKGRMHARAHVNINKLIDQEKKEKREQDAYLALGVAIVLVVLWFFFSSLMLGWAQTPLAQKTATNKLAYVFMSSVVLGLLITPIIRKITYFFFITPFYIPVKQRAWLRRTNPRALRAASIKRFIVYFVVGFAIWETTLFILV